MENVFLKYPEFIDSDVRTKRKFIPNAGTYNVNNQLQYIRHSMSLPGELVKGKTVLDLGCCVGASGAWVLEAGATKYVGVELQSKFCQLARSNLTKYFSKTRWEIKEQSFTEFFKSNKEQFDIVIAWGSLYHTIDFQTALTNFISVAKDVFIIDSIDPPNVRTLFEKAKLPSELLQFIPYVEYPISSTGMISEEGKSLHSHSALPNLSSVKFLLSQHGFNLERDFTNDLQSLLPVDYKQRFFATFKRGSKTEYLEFETIYRDESKKLYTEFNDVPEKVNYTWRFDAGVADVFVDHAEKHIPDYQRVIKKSIDVCKQLIKDPAEDRIIDVGCATGETIKQLFGADFHNLVGVDSSQEMLAKVEQLPIAFWIHSNQFPEGNFHGVLCNWTLHFIQEKLEYITSMYNNIVPGGFLILTDKTKNSGIDLELYHEFKRQQGVSEEEIVSKAESLKDVMFIDSVDWYLDTLRQVGFKEVSIINSAPCFTTFLAIKN